MTILDTPDWSKPMPGGSRLILNTGFNLLVGGGQYVSSWMDVNAYNGLHVETNGFDLAGDFGTLEVQFQDAAGVQPILAKYDAIWRGDMAAQLNVPVMGAQARVVITGPAHNVNAQLIVTGHGGGGSSSYRGHARALASFRAVTIAAGSTTSTFPLVITEGPGHLVGWSTAVGPWMARVWAADANGNFGVIGATDHVAGLGAQTVPLWIPPAPLFFEVQNDSGSSGSFYAALILGRA